MIKVYIAIKITKGKRNDHKSFKEMVIRRGIKDKCYADKGYISKNLFTRLYTKELILITGIKNNMKNYLISILDKLLHKKLFIIKTIFGYIKEHFNIKPNKRQFRIKGDKNCLNHQVLR